MAAAGIAEFDIHLGVCPLHVERVAVIAADYVKAPDGCVVDEQIVARCAAAEVDFDRVLEVNQRHHQRLLRLFCTVLAFEPEFPVRRRRLIA
ncbi:MAG: hypothetical protein AAGG08_16000 [Actinomycetota bacterium]